MKQTEILAILDQAAHNFVFPMLDNGYVYLAKIRLNLFRSDHDWAMVFEWFGYATRQGMPDLTLFTIGSHLRNRKSADQFISKNCYEEYLTNQKHHEATTFWPISNEDWLDHANPDQVRNVGQVHLRDKIVSLPSKSAYGPVGITLEETQPFVFELCRYLAAIYPDDVMATKAERRVNVPHEFDQVMVLNDWRHPDLASSEKPSDLSSFQQMAAVLESGDVSFYSPDQPGNTAWQNWPDGGTL
ncbi:DUF7003 family protein [Parasulfitobacter algicola]|uniref:Uncharacterized protein n=1 Tax=Parasulfitobacter algicola TaxID=2614809 RepID=A0ABX2J004_9RHOB|nr:hypothetical protein [Sulfitobacter algicola]NSX56379.1 hypothetical protein [Sulfitobacter algicola]